jgi:epoxyqueuosine reductase
MISKELIDRIFLYASHSGYEVKIVSSKHLKELENELKFRKETDGFDDAFYLERLTSFRYNPIKTFTKCQSIIIFAVPQSKELLRFQLNGKDHAVYIPPTYDWSIDSVIENDLKDILTYKRYTIERAIIPLKLLAVRCGLAEYGKNNICYIHGKGSYYRLVAFYSDFSCPEETWRPVCLMEKCETCKACVLACPTGAIDGKRFLLHAELCISFHNEHPGTFPDFINPSFHNCLFGCMKCQNVCPENRQKSAWVKEQEYFSEHETAFILSNRPLFEMPLSTRQKLERLHIIDDYPMLSRNLNHCINSFQNA